MDSLTKSILKDFTSKMDTEDKRESKSRHKAKTNLGDLPTMLENLSDPNGQPSPASISRSSIGNISSQSSHSSIIANSSSNHIPSNKDIRSCPSFRSANFDFSKFLRNYQCRKQSSRQRTHFLEISLLENCSWTSKYPIRNVYEDYDCKTRLLRLGAYKPCIYNGSMHKFINVQKYVSLKFPLDLQAVIILPSETNVDMLLSMELHLEIVTGNDYTYQLARNKFPIDQTYVKLYKSLEPQMTFIDNRPYLQLKKHTQNQAEVWAIIENYQNVTFLTGRKTNTTHDCQICIEKYCEFGSISGRSHQYVEPVLNHAGLKKFCSFKFKTRENETHELVPFMSKHQCSIEEDIQIEKRRCRSDIMFFVKELYNKNDWNGSFGPSPENLLKLIEEKFPNVGFWKPNLQMVKNLSALAKQTKKKNIILDQKRLEIIQIAKENSHQNHSTNQSPNDHSTINHVNLIGSSSGNITNFDEYGNLENGSIDLKLESDLPSLLISSENVSNLQSPGSEHTSHSYHIDTNSAIQIHPKTSLTIVDDSPPPSRASRGSNSLETLQNTKNLMEEMLSNGHSSNHGSLEPAFKKVKLERKEIDKETDKDTDKNKGNDLFANLQELINNRKQDDNISVASRSISPVPTYSNKADFSVQADMRESMEFSIQFGGATWRGVLFKD